MKPRSYVPAIHSHWALNVRMAIEPARVAAKLDPKEYKVFFDNKIAQYGRLSIYYFS
jgi:hypothetical protein